MNTLHLTNPPQHGAAMLQRALAAARLFPELEVDGLYTPQTAHAAEVAKFRLGYPLADIHHGHEFAGDTLLAYLTGKRELPASYARRRHERLHPGPVAGSEEQRRAAVVAEFRWLIAHEPQVHYAMTRPIPVSLPRHAMPAGGIVTDCSGAVTLACKWAGLPDPNGLGYNGQGFTGTLLSHLPHISRAHVRPGDLVVFGPGSGDHVCMVLDPAGPMELGSHGQEKGPLSVPLAVEVASHAPPTTFLAVL